MEAVSSVGGEAGLAPGGYLVQTLNVATSALSACTLYILYRAGQVRTAENSAP